MTLGMTKLKAIAKEYKGLTEIFEQHMESWVAAAGTILPARKLLALFYENLRIESSAVNVIAMTQIGAIRYLDYKGPMALENYWAAWKPAVKDVAGLIKPAVLLDMLDTQLIPCKVIETCKI